MVAERFLYLPSVGLSIVLAFGFSTLAKRFSLRAIIVSVLIIVTILTSLSWARNAVWGSNVLLFEATYQDNPKRIRIISGLVDAHIVDKNYARAVEICDQHRVKVHKTAHLGQPCGLAYAFGGKYGKAEQAFLSATKDNRAAATAHFTLANLFT